MKFCNVAMPYRATRVYDRSAMGIPCSERALVELMRRVRVISFKKACLISLQMIYIVVATLHISGCRVRPRS